MARNLLVLLKKSSSCLLGCLLATGLWAAPALAFDVSGEYKGFYQYYDSERDSIVGHFTITIKQQGEQVSGQIREPRTDFGPDTPFLYSDLTGTIEGSEEQFVIDFTKTYRYDGHQVHYRGTYRSHVGEIQGDWNIGRDRGNFKIAQINPQPDLDLEPPNLLLVKPAFIAADGGAVQRGISLTVRPGAEVVGFAADNVRVGGVEINGQPATLSEPTEAERHLLRGNVVKFTSRLEPGSAGQPVRVTARDRDGNSRQLEFTVQPTSKAAGIDAVGLPSALYGRKIAVVIGINSYQAWPPLEGAVNDAVAMRDYLGGQGYEVLTLMEHEASRANILKTLGYELPRRAGDNDAVLVYFAGHGHTESLRDGDREGYIVPVDAGVSDCFLSAISMRQLRSITQRIKAKHIMFIMDSCYSGLGFSRAAGVAPGASDYIKKITSFRAVQMITAGGMNEQVAEAGGRGLFTRNLLLALNGRADLDRDGYITGSELGTYLRPVVSKASGNRQTPNFGRFEGEGEYIFSLDGQPAGR